MKLAIMQPYFLPYLGYFQLIHSVDEIILYDNLNYIKKGWVNRNRILVYNSLPIYITIPLIMASANNKISEIIIDNDKPWRKKILTDLFFNYKRAEHFDEIYPLIEDIINYETISLSEFNTNSIKKIVSFLDINTKIITDISKYYPLDNNLNNNNLSDDDLKMFLPITEEKKVLRVLYICKKENAETFINPIGGTSLYNKDTFLKAGINVFFINTNDYQYKQQQKDNFTPHLSIIDVLMNCGKEQCKNLLNNYKLI